MPPSQSRSAVEEECLRWFEKHGGGRALAGGTQFDEEGLPAYGASEVEGASKSEQRWTNQYYWRFPEVLVQS
jgi:hypothetical protein